MDEEQLRLAKRKLEEQLREEQLREEVKRLDKQVKDMQFRNKHPKLVALGDEFAKLLNEKPRKKGKMLK